MKPEKLLKRFTRAFQNVLADEIQKLIDDARKEGYNEGYADGAVECHDAAAVEAENEIEETGASAFDAGYDAGWADGYNEAENDFGGY